MILLEYHNRIVYETLLERFSSADKPETVDVVLADFDGVVYHLSTPTSKTKIQLSMSMKCYKECQLYGGDQVMQREYGSYWRTGADIEPGYEVTVEFDLEALPEDPKERDALCRKAALIKRNALAAPFERAFDQSLSPTKSLSTSSSAPHTSTGEEVMIIPYRDEETIFIMSKADRVTVIFQTTFKEEADKIYGKVFLQEFVDARRQPAIQTAPQVLYSPRVPPLELAGIPNLKEADNVGYVTFVLFPRHFTPARRLESLSRIQFFRDDLHYHINCSKAYMHSRMRARVDQFLKILNRAKPEIPDHLKEKKTASGKTFHRS